MIGFYIFFALFLIACGFQLFFCYEENEKWRKITKPFCSGLLLVALAFYDYRQILVLVATTMYLIGDVVLLLNYKKNHVAFVFGGSFFCLGHLCLSANFILLLISLGFPFSPAFYASFAVILSIFFVSMVLIDKKVPFKERLGFPINYTVILFNALLACTIMYYGFPLEGSIIFIGYLSILISDILIKIKIFYKPIQKISFYIMLTYLFAIGFILIGAITLLSLNQLYLI